jgi:hypothetical protein
MADIFMSYSRTDRSRAEQLANALSAQGWSVWWDRKIAAGSSFDKMIERELDAAKCVLVLWSHASTDSEWVKNEAAAAMEREALIPVMIENARLPIEFRRRQTIDLAGWNGQAADSSLTPLFEAIAERLGQPAKAPPAPRPQQPSPTVSKSRLPIWVAGAVAVALIGIGYFTLGGDDSSVSDASGESMAEADLEAVDPPPIEPDTAAPETAASEPDGAADAPTPEPAPDPTADAVTYAMTCHGGGPFEVRREPTGGVRVGFAPSDQPASPAMLPGECSWSDRAISENEPRSLCDATAERTQLVEALGRKETVTVQVYFEPETNCFRVVRF